MNEDWQTLKSQEIHRNPWYRLMQDDVLMPSGQVGKYTYVDRAAGVIILAFDADQKIYLVGQYRYPSKKFSWEVPMGTLEKSDTDVLAAAKRELREEVGLEAETWTEVGTFFYANGVSNQMGHVYLAEQIEQKESMPDYTEFLSMKKVTVAELEDLIASGEITDAPTIAAYYKLTLYRGRV
jgi:8-oxo-dGTP pyrophosphatase MutT (NUDIX family)